MLNQFDNHLNARRRSPATIRIRMIYLRQLAARHDLATVTTTQLEALLASHRNDWKPQTVNAAISSWRVFFKWAVKTGHLDHNPAEDLELVHVPHEPQAIASDDRIRAGLDGSSDSEHAMILLGRECGLRRTEIATLRIESRRDQWVTVTGKGGKVRRSRLSDALDSLLDSLAGERTEGYFFEGDHDGHVAPATVYRIALRLTGTGAHALRRRAITTVYRASGNDIRLAQEFAGHSDPAITAVYIMIDDDDMIRAGGLATLAA